MRAPYLPGLVPPLLAACLFAAPAAATPAAKVWQPSGPTNLHQQPEYCTLSRSFVLSEETILLQFRSGFSLATYQTTLASLTALDKGRSGKVELTLAGQDMTGDFDAQAGRVPGRNERFLHWYSHDFYLPGMVSEDQTFRISNGSLTLELHWTGAGEAFRQFARCQDATLAVLGMDVAAMRAIHAAPKPANFPGMWATSDDYPPAARRARMEGEVDFLLTVGPDGAIVDCRIVRSSGHQELDQRTCSLLRQRAKFAPARGADGETVTGYYLNRLRWKLPD